MSVFFNLLGFRGVKRSHSSPLKSGLMPLQSVTSVAPARADGLAWATPPEHAPDTTSESVLRAFASLPTDQVLDHLQVERDGLSGAEAEARLRVKGPNTLRSQKPPSWFILLLKVIPNPFNILLIFLAIINASIPPPDWTGFTVLMVMVSISVIVRFWQEYRSGLAVFRLQMSIKTAVRVRRREVETHLPTSELVPGDIVLLAPGDVVPADCLVLEASFLRVSQSQWTGESAPVSKVASSSGDKTDGSLFDLCNICFMGTGVVSGNATVVILRTGSDALIAAMSKALHKKRGMNAFQRGIQNVTWMLIGFMGVMVPIVLVVSAKTTGDWGQAALFSISVAVGLVPEMLPAIVNANLARGAYLLSKKKAIVRRLDSVQNLGAMTVLCSDKTGTLTKDEITMRAALDWSGNADLEVLKLAVIEATIQGAAGNNMDAAIRKFRLQNGEEVQTTKYDKSLAIPFDFERRRSSCIVRGVAGGAMLICKGAFEEVYSRCSKIQTDKGDSAMAGHHRTILKQQVQTLNGQGYRVLLVATKQLAKARVDDEDSFEDIETDMTVHGLVTFVDPPKPDAAESINQLKTLGVDVKVLTGDNMAVALNVCRALGLVQREDSIDNDGPEAMTGAELANLVDEHDFDEAVKSCKVFAKVSPVQKESIVASLKKHGHAVGMLGDGMNDCLALRKADVGISVDSAAGAAKDCADFILTEKGLAIIVESVTIGRVTHANSIKYIKMVLSSNFGNVFSILAASAWLPFTPMTNLQILAQNLLYDISQIAIPWDKVDAEFLESPKSWRPWDLLRFVVVLGPTSSVIDVCTFLLGWFYYGIRTTEDPAAVSQFQTHWFLQGLLTQTLIVHLLRTAKLPFVQSRSSIHLGLSTAAIMAVGFVLPWIPAFHSALSFVNPKGSFIGFLFAELVAYCIEVQLVKMAYIRLFKDWL
ncbi:Mg-transporting ATPase [Cordyceps javanica]|uniref:Magnesium-transporting ATPase, P-type 1 n=1 Tax=Cordyceps javanica TaxID=43265 RepID=A0A545V165_9HYPO|nr:Mg-transporting ATPase [Cordyceps javanica]TQW02573.1 Mg-transporting ATPase [Cordyceps javanica]